MRRLRVLREEKGLSLRDLGAKVRRSPEFLLNVEKGLNTPSTHTMYALIQVFGFDQALINEWNKKLDESREVRLRLIEEWRKSSEGEK